MWFRHVSEIATWNGGQMDGVTCNTWRAMMATLNICKNEPLIERYPITFKMICDVEKATPFHRYEREFRFEASYRRQRFYDRVRGALLQIPEHGKWRDSVWKNPSVLVCKPDRKTHSIGLRFGGNLCGSSKSQYFSGKRMNFCSFSSVSNTKSFSRNSTTSSGSPSISASYLRQYAMFEITYTQTWTNS